MRIVRWASGKVRTCAHLATRPLVRRLRGELDRRARRRKNHSGARYEIMPILLEDLAEETWASNARVADRVDAEVRDLEKLRGAASALENLRQKASESARQASDYALTRLPEAKG